MLCQFLERTREPSSTQVCNRTVVLKIVEEIPERNTEGGRITNIKGNVHNRLVVQAAAQAQKAADFILGQHADQQEKEDGQ